MSRLTWNEVGERYFFTGLDRGVLYTEDKIGHAWNGLVSIDEQPSLEGSTENYFDGQKYFQLNGIEEFSAALVAFTYPEIFEEYDGLNDGRTAHRRKKFSLSYRTKIGNDLESSEHAYQIHILYNALATPSAKSYMTVAEEIEPVSFSWNLSTLPVSFDGIRPTSHLIIDTRLVYPWVLEILEDLLYGTDETQPRLPTIDEIYDIFEDGSILKIIDHGDGTWSAIGPDEAITMLDSTTFEITWPSAKYLNPETYTIHSL